MFYKSSDLPAQYQALYRLNPMVHLMEAYRSILLSGTAPEAMGLLLLILPALALLYIGYHVFKKASDHFVDEL